MIQDFEPPEPEWISPPFEPEINMFGLSFKLTSDGFVKKEKPEAHEEGKNEA